MTCIKNGAYVSIPAYGVFAPADIYTVGGYTTVVRFPGDPREMARTPGRSVTHELDVNGADNFWRPDIGIAVVQNFDLREVRNEQSDQQPSG